MRVMVLLLSTLLISACNPLKPVTVTPAKNYTLTAVNMNKLAPKYRRKTVLVNTPSAAPGFQTPAMIYVIKPYEQNIFANNQWVSAPANILLPLMVQSLRNTNSFRAVVAAPFAGLTDFRLDTKLLKLQQNFTTKPSRIEMQVQADLIDNNTNRVIDSRRFNVNVPTTENTPYAGVIAANTATKKIMQDIAQFAVG